MNCTEILTRTAETYARCESYQDKGDLQSSICGTMQILSFETHFVRPVKYYFKWQSHHPFFGENGPKFKHVVWTTADRCLSLLMNRRMEGANIAELIAMTTGVSQMAGYVVPTLLLPEAAGRTVIGQPDFERLADEEVTGVQCFHLRNNDTELWIDCASYLLRRWRFNLPPREGQSENSSVSDCRYLEVEQNGEIDEKYFTLDACDL